MYFLLLRRVGFSPAAVGSRSQSPETGTSQFSFPFRSLATLNKGLHENITVAVSGGGVVAVVA
eukprot:5436014-Lingulodinium_polyedra.AAC.1